MIKLKQAVIVEGKYDKIKLSSVIDAVIITTDGFGIYKNKAKLELIRSFAEKSGVIILTDSDNAGRQIRNHLKKCINGGNIINVYIPDIFGKERRKDKPSAEGKLGVEGIDTATLIAALERFGVTADNSVRDTTIPVITREMLFDDGFIGNTNSVKHRKRLLKELSLPENLSVNSLLDVLNILCDEKAYRIAVNKINDMTED